MLVTPMGHSQAALCPTLPALGPAGRGGASRWDDQRSAVMTSASVAKLEPSRGLSRAPAAERGCVWGGRASQEGL